MKKNIAFITGYILLLICMQGFAQPINKIEYYIDNDPGFGNGTNVAVTAAANIPDLLIPVDITSLNKGFHNIYVRSRNDVGKWSLTNRWLFVKDILSGNVNKLEYFIDTDPGFGNATDVSITPGSNIANIAIPVNISALSKGFHNIYIRSKDNTGRWNLTNRWLFVKDITSANAGKLEYFIDTDPGFGNATDVAVTPSANISNVLIPVDISSLSKGFHNLYLRSKDNTGNWALTNRWLFFKDIAQNNLQTGEYFFDTDPGFGNGTAIPFGGGLGTNVSDFSFGASLSGLPLGTHYLFIRTKELNGKWSLTNVIPFVKASPPLPVGLVYFNVKAEGKKAHLNWQTSTEQNSDRFEIERSFDGLQFEKIGFVKAAGNSNAHLDYSYFDLTPKKGINYYRLKQVDINNRFEFSAIKTAQFGDVVLFALYNNPSNGTDIQMKANIFPATLSVFDASGRKMKEVNLVNSNYSLSVTGFANGTYLAVLNRDGKVIAVEKFVISK